MQEITGNPLFKGQWFYNEEDIAQKIRKIRNLSQQTNEGIFKIHTFIEYGRTKAIVQNDIIALNAYSHKYIELIIFMFQDVINSVSIHIT